MRILHISDLHAPAEVGQDQQRIAQALLADIAEQDRAQRVDLVVEAYAMVLACGPGGGKLTMGGEAARLYSTLGVTSAKGGKLSSN